MPDYTRTYQVYVLHAQESAGPHVIKPLLCKLTLLSCPGGKGTVPLTPPDLSLSGLEGWPNSSSSSCMGPFPHFPGPPGEAGGRPVACLPCCWGLGVAGFTCRAAAAAIAAAPDPADSQSVHATKYMKWIPSMQHTHACIYACTINMHISTHTHFMRASAQSNHIRT